MALFVFFHSFLELHLKRAQLHACPSPCCGSIKLWEDTDRVNNKLLCLDSPPNAWNIFYFQLLRWLDDGPQRGDHTAFISGFWSFQQLMKAFKPLVSDARVLGEAFMEKNNHKEPPNN